MSELSALVNLENLQKTMEPHTFGTTFWSHIKDEMLFHILTKFGWNKTILNERKWNHKWHYHSKKFSFVITLKVNTQNIYPEVLDQIWSIYICENYINVSLNQTTIINLSIGILVTFLGYRLQSFVEDFSIPMATDALDKSAASISWYVTSFDVAFPKIKM